MPVTSLEAIAVQKQPKCTLVEKSQVWSSDLAKSERDRARTCNLLRTEVIPKSDALPLGHTPYFLVVELQLDRMFMTVWEAD